MNEACEDWLGDSSATPGYPLHTLSAVKRIKLCDDVVKNVKNRPKTPKTGAKQVKLSWTPSTPYTPSRTPSPPPQIKLYDDVVKNDQNRHAFEIKPRTPFTPASTPYTPSRTPSPPPLASPASNYEENEVMPCLESFDKSSQVKTIRLTFDVCDEKQRHITQTKTEASAMLELQGGHPSEARTSTAEGFRFSCSNCHESWPLNQTRLIAQHMSKGTAPLTKAIRTVFSSLFKHWSYKVRLLVNPQSYTVSRYVFK